MMAPNTPAAPSTTAPVHTENKIQTPESPEGVGKINHPRNNRRWRPRQAHVVFSLYVCLLYSWMACNFKNQDI